MRTNKFTLILLACLMQPFTAVSGNSCSASVDTPQLQPVEIVYNRRKMTIHIPLAPGAKPSERPLMGTIIIQQDPEDPDGRIIRYVDIKSKTTTGWGRR